MIRPLAFALGLCACGGTLTASQARHGTQAPSPAEAAPTKTAAPAHAEAVQLRRAAHHDMTEVVLDPRGRAALTLDRDGGVRLWPAVASEHASTPWVLPMQEPTWMSLARAGSRAFVVAHVDTTGGGHVGRVEITDDDARFVPLFDVPPTDPLFELWVLDGGRRILALGIDHRVRLYDTDGELLSVIDQHGFVPWQLRVVQTPGEPPAIAAVLARPTRAQRILLQDDTLSISGDAHMVALDQSPNRNDLALAPDGRTIGALRRPKHRGTTWWLELIDLDTGKRRKLTGDADARVRPRLHLLQGDRALLHAGTGKGQRVDLGAARAVEIGDTPPPPAEFLDAVSEVEVPGSLGEARMQTTVAAGVRAVVDGGRLIADPIDDPAVFTHGVRPFRPRLGALSPDGTRVVWAGGREVYVEEKKGELRELPSAGDTIVLVAFIDDARVLVVSGNGVATIRSGPDGAVVARATVPKRRAIVDAAWHGNGDGSGTLSIAGRRDARHTLAVHDGAFADRAQPRSGTGKALVRAVGRRDLEIAAHASDEHGRHWLATAGRRPALYRVEDGNAEPVGVRHGKVQRIFAAGDLLAVVQAAPGGGPAFTLSVYDGAAAKRLWTRRIADAFAGSFSADRTTIVLADAEGGLLVDARTGKPRRRRDRS